MYIAWAIPNRGGEVGTWVQVAAVALLALTPGWSRRQVAADACPTASQLSLTAVTTRSGAMSGLDLGSLTSFGNAGGPDLYSVTVFPHQGAYTFKLSVMVKLIPTDPQVGQSCVDPYESDLGGHGCWLQKQTTVPLHVVDPSAPAAGYGGLRGPWSRTSSQMQSVPKEPGGIEPDQSPFKQLVSRTGSIPAGQFLMKFELLCEDGQVIGGTTRTLGGLYQPAQVPNLLFPGQDASTGFPELLQPRPTFLWSGNLDGLNFGGSAPYRLSVWEVHASQSVDEAEQSRTTFQKNVFGSPLVWPAEWPSLEEGKKYVWRVDALVRGLSDSWRPSRTFGFQIPTKSTQPPLLGQEAADGTPDQNEMLRLLAALAGAQRYRIDPVLRSALPDPSTLRINGRPASLEQLRVLYQRSLDQQLTTEFVGQAP